jgi:septum formation protein
MSAAVLPPIVLASSSRYRAELLGRILPRFTQIAAEVDETALPGETPSATAVRLATNKARAVAELNPGSLVIGSDQVAELEGLALGKPGTIERAQAQLAACSGKAVEFHTALCLADARGSDLVMHTALDLTRVVFRSLDTGEIARYLARDEPLDCAGSFKIERLGVALFDQVESHDPSALIGLPLIRLCGLLRDAGLLIP